jgi:hypothetical protein
MWGQNDGGSAPVYGHQSPDADAILNGTCAPHGDRFGDVYACDTVQGPSPNEPPGAVAAVSPDPETAADPDYDWVLAELEACSCTCCHTNDGVGTYRWSATFAPAWSDSADNGSLSLLGRYGINSSAAIPLEENNGFSREQSGHPSTDPERFNGFVDRELDRRDP